MTKVFRNINILKIYLMYSKFKGYNQNITNYLVPFKRTFHTIQKKYHKAKLSDPVATHCKRFVFCENTRGWWFKTSLSKLKSAKYYVGSNLQYMENSTRNWINAMYEISLQQWVLAFICIFRRVLFSWKMK